MVIADDQPVVREGLSVLLAAAEGFEPVGWASDSAELLSLVHGRSPDVVLLDTRLEHQEGVVVAQWVMLRHPSVGVLLFPSEITEEAVERALACGVSGVILKSAPFLEILDAIATVARGGTVLGRGVRTPSDSSRLTRREREVLRRLAEGMNNREISESLFISMATTKTHLENIARKLGTTHRAAAVAEGIRRGLVA